MSSTMMLVVGGRGWRWWKIAVVRAVVIGDGWWFAAVV